MLQSHRRSWAYHVALMVSFCWWMSPLWPRVRGVARAEDRQENPTDTHTSETMTTGMREQSSNGQTDENDNDANVVTWDSVEDSFFDPLQADPDCTGNDARDMTSCWSPPGSTVGEETIIKMDASCSFGGDDPDQALVAREETCQAAKEKGGETIVDQHWGSDPQILRMRNKLRDSGSGVSGLASNNEKNRRPPIFLMPGLASTRLVAWRYKACPQHPLLSDVRVLDYVWLNINLIMQMGTIDVSCMRECLSLGINQTDTDDFATGCKLRADEGLDAISSLSPGGLQSDLFVGGTNTVYSWLIQWLSDNLGYDVSSMVGFPYDWRLSPDKMEHRDGFLTLTRRRIEAAVQSNGEPGIFVAHSMGNLIFRYFLLWLRNQLRREAYDNLIDQVNRRAEIVKRRGLKTEDGPTHSFSGWLGSRLSILDDLISKAKGKVEEDETIREKLRELGNAEGDLNWRHWIDRHIWTYVGLSAPMLGAVNPLRSVISGENMGIPIPDEEARVMELTFGSTHTVNPISMTNAFCDQWTFEEWDEQPEGGPQEEYDSSLGCLDDIAKEISEIEGGWDNFPALKSLLWDRKNWDTNIINGKEVPMIEVIEEECEKKEKSPCKNSTSLALGPKDVETGYVFVKLQELWKEKDSPLLIKRAQLQHSFWDTDLINVLNTTWDRPPIKHVIMAYGVDIPTEVGYTYRKTNNPKKKKKNTQGDEYDGVPDLERVLWETAGGELSEQKIEANRGGLADLIKKVKRKPVGKTGLVHSGDGSVPYISLSYVHTWLLHALRARAHESNEDIGAHLILDSIDITHRPLGGTKWLPGFAPGSSEMKDEIRKGSSSDTGTDHPHGTRYKPEMLRYHTVGTSRVTGQNYSTTVIEALGVEHKETTRNYDILAAVFTDVLRRMHDDFDFI